MKNPPSFTCGQWEEISRVMGSEIQSHKNAIDIVERRRKGPAAEIALSVARERVVFMDSIRAKIEAYLTL